MDGWHFFFRLPPSFRKDPKARFQHGGSAFVDGNRRIINGVGYVCAPGPDAPGCSECVDTIAGHPFVLTSSYENGLYHLAATNLHKGLAGGHGLHLTSPDSADQDLFFAIVRTLQERSRTSKSGVLFLGGHEMQGPIVLTCPEGRLTVNGYWMPDLVPSTSRQPTGNAELEARRTIAARIAAQRDILLASGFEWPEVQERLRATALKSPFVKSVGLESHTDSILSLFTISWAFGYNTTVLGRRSGSNPGSGGSARSFEEDWQFWTARLDYLKGLLDNGRAVFLLGGGCEYVVDPGDGGRAVAVARRLAQGRQLRGRERTVLPDDIQEQLRKPLLLERAE